MPSAIALAVTMVSYDHVALRWSVTPLPSAAAFDLYRSNNPTTGFELVTSGIDGATYTDLLNLRARFRPVFYMLKGLVDGEEVTSSVVGIEAEPNMTTLVLSKRERFQLAKNDGNAAWLYPKRKWGPKCSVCTTEAAQPLSFCPRCYGTRYEGGFFPPVPLYVSFKRVTAERGGHQPTHVEERDTNSLWTANWALVSPEDVIIEAGPPNLVWIVEGVSRTAYNRSPLSQTLQVNTVERGHVYYDLPRPAFAWPAHEEIWYESFNDSDKGFDDMWSDRLKAYLATNPTTLHAPGIPAVAPAGPVIQVDPGDYDPFGGGFR